MARLAHLVAKASGRLSRRLGKGGGTTLPGVVLLRLQPRAVEDLASGLAQGSLTISATNGKTTTARMIRSITDAAGWHSVANTAGSNLLRGVAAALLDAPKNAELGVFEVDEAALPSVVDQARPNVVVLMNLFRDQLDRYGELETLVSLWRTMIDAMPASTVLVLNADDPAVAHLGHERPNSVYFGLDDTRHGRGKLAHAADSTHCPRCDALLTYDVVTIGHLGHWRCTECGLARPEPTVSASAVELHGLDGSTVAIETPDGVVDATLALSGLHNAYNAVAAVAGTQALGAPLGVMGAALGQTDAAFGRGERVRLHDRDLLLLLAKNPTGANENVRTALLDPRPLHVMAFLNDRTADGQDVSWIWDVDYEPLFDRAETVTLSGDRAYDLALRFVYGGCDRDRIRVEPDIAAALDAMVERTNADDTVYALPTYTAMLDLRAELVRRGVADDFWEDA